MQLAKVKEGQSRLLRVCEVGCSVAVSATICPIPKLIVHRYRPGSYDLRHSGVTWRLKCGRPGYRGPRVGRPLGRGAERVYARYVVGLEDVRIGRMNEALHLGEDR